jgi:hypothetical protein
MRSWIRCIKLSLILIVAIGSTLSVQLPWASGLIFAAPVLPKSHSLTAANPISYIIPNAFIHPAIDNGLTSPLAQIASTASAASEFVKDATAKVASSANDPVPPATSAKRPEPYIVGKAIQLLPTGPTEISLLSNGQIHFVATLINEHNSFWHITVTGMVELADGSKVTVLQPHSLWMVPGQELRLPVALTADPARFPPGWTQFKALLRDDQGQIIDQASVNFLLTLDLTKPHS